MPQRLRAACHPCIRTDPDLEAYFVANIKSQLKRIKTNEKARLRNKGVKSSLKTSVRKFREAAEAYEVLSKPETRELYDRFGQDGLRTGGFRPTDFDFTSVGVPDTSTAAMPALPIATYAFESRSATSNAA